MLCIILHLCKQVLMASGLWVNYADMRVTSSKGRRFNLRNCPFCPSKIEWDLTNRPLSKLLELLDTQV